MSSPPTVVAIDGPAGSGKSSVARRLALRLGLPYLDTGAMYRALGLLALDRGVDPDDRDAASALAAGAELAVRLGADGSSELLVGGSPIDPRIRQPEVGAATSRLAVHPEVRARMVALQREFVRNHGGVLEGRDIGTRVVPETPCKFFLDAAPEVRTRRRLEELRGQGMPIESQALAHEIAERDARDRSRPESPLTPAPDAVRVDTSGLTLDEVVGLLERVVRERVGAAS
ncbi:MAG: (d)CMP kinase [Thermoanaerobaculia bacterium]|nr:(d)CMP kinase [Thermoanaerobaculia bacterium]